MAGLPPPEGMTEDDYDAIHAAVVETVRGRWFLSEFARRSRVDEVREMLTAIGRLESVVTEQRAALPTPVEATPHTRLLAQRADDIASRLTGIIEDLRDSGADDYLCDELETQVRAIAALHKGNAETAPALTSPASISPAWAGAPQALTASESANPTLANQISPPQGPPRQDPPVSPLRPVMPASQIGGGKSEARATALAALAAIDRLSLAEKLALFA